MTLPLHKFRKLLFASAIATSLFLPVFAKAQEGMRLPPEDMQSLSPSESAAAPPTPQTPIQLAPSGPPVPEAVARPAPAPVVDAVPPETAGGVKAAARNTARVPVRIGEHANYTRIVFDFPRLTAYTTEKSAGALHLVFDTDGSIRLPRDTYQFIGGLQLGKIGKQPRVTVKTTAKTTVYRLDNKIVVDLVSPAVEPKPAAPKPVETRVADASPKPETKPEAAPVPAPAATEAAPQPASTEPVKTAETPTPAEPSKPEAATPLATAANIVIDKLPETDATPEPAPAAAAVKAAETVLATDEQASPEAVEAPATKITFSTVEPTRLAVFTRFNTLWVVLDSEAAGAIAPDASGPEAGLLGSPKIFKIKGGTAYRYSLPPKRYVSVQKESLTWNVLVSTTQKQLPSRAQVMVEYDETSQKAKLMAEIKGASNPLELQDPAVGDTLIVLATSEESQRLDRARRFTDLEILPASIGMVIRPLADGVRANRIEEFVLVSSPGGIIATPGAVAGPTPIAVAEEQDDPTETRLFDFPNWRQGGVAKLDRNRRQLLEKIARAKKPEEKQDLMMKLALLYFANNLGQESSGMLRLIEQQNTDMAKNLNFIALRGASAAMAGRYTDALKDLSHPLLQKHPEVSLWIGYAAAQSEQWKMANRAFPKSNKLLLKYPENLAVPFTIYMAESALRLGRTDSASALLTSLDSMSADLDAHHLAAIQYLKGEAARQSGNPAEAMKLWQPVANGLDRLYHAKASLALTNLKLQEKKISTQQAIDTVDSLRFAWRGDGLEVQILENLGTLKVKDKKYLSGLEDMRAAARLADEILDDSQPIRDNMAGVFSDLFVRGGNAEISPLEAASIYTGFTDLMPDGMEGSVAALNFADTLISIDLLEKAEALLDGQIKSGLLSPAKLSATGSKLAAVYLLDRQPGKALDALRDTERDGIAGEARDERDLLRARALSELNQTNEAIALLSAMKSKDALRLKSDVLWRAKRWQEAATTISSLLPDPSLTPSESDAELVVNAAVAYKLAVDPAAVRDLRAKYLKQMSRTTLGSTFGVVTRSGGSTSLADRETILKIAGEVDMFKGFLDSYKASTKSN
jgi:hypothetical protein